jgi:glutathione S-transferase
MTADDTSKSQKAYHTKATGQALKTARQHSADNELKLYGSCFWYVPTFSSGVLTDSHSPFVHRVWISLEHKKIPYQYVEIDPYKKPKELLDINPRGLVPALTHKKWGCYESTVLMEYVRFSSLSMLRKET